MHGSLGIWSHNLRGAPEGHLPTGDHAVEDMRRIAYETVLRACGFGSLAIFCVMIGMSFKPRSPSRPAGS